MLQIIGKTLEVTTERVTPAQGQAFDSTTVAVMTGKAGIERVRLGRDFEGDWPKEGENIALEVVVSAFSGRNGAGYRVTALRRASAGARIAAAS